MVVSEQIHLFEGARAKDGKMGPFRSPASNAKHHLTVWSFLQRFRFNRHRGRSAPCRPDCRENGNQAWQDSDFGPACLHLSRKAFMAAQRPVFSASRITSRENNVAVRDLWNPAAPPHGRSWKNATQIWRLEPNYCSAGEPAEELRRFGSLHRRPNAAASYDHCEQRIFAQTR